MNDVPLLTIAIPTYNRVGKVCERMGELLPQLDERVELRIVDNASDWVVEDEVRRHLGEEIGSRVLFHRNVTNVGLAANLCRCFEHAAGEWVWVLGDDDAVLPGAVRTVLDRLMSLDANAGFAGFSTSIYAHPESNRLEGFDGLVKGGDQGKRLSNLLFISAGCYRLRLIKPHLRTGYLMVYSHVPHVAMLAAMLAEEEVCAEVFPDRVVERPAPVAGQTWSHLKLLSGLPALMDLENVDPSIGVVVRRIIVDARWRPFVRAGLQYIFNDTGRTPKFWILLLLRIFICGDWRMKGRVLILIASLPLALTAASRACVQKLVNAGTRADVNEGSDRL